MRIRFIIMQSLLLVSAAGFAQRGWGVSPNDTLHSTIVTPEGKVLFQIYAPEAKLVSVSGDLPYSSPVRFVKKDNGVWQGVLNKIDNGVFRYSFSVDGVRVFDPKSEYGQETSALLTVAPTGNEYFIRKNVPHGAVAQRFYHSDVLGRTMRLHVWTPAGYERKAKKLPVLYLIHGGGDTDNAWPTVGAAGDILDNLLAEGKMEPMIVVMPNGSVETSAFTDELMTDIIPFIESNYKVKTGSKNRAIAGLSMGGMEVLDALTRHYDSFDSYWVLSSGWFPAQAEDFKARGDKLMEISDDLKKHVKKLAFYQGGPEDIAYNNCLAMLKLFDAAGIEYEFHEGPGGHSWFTWRRDLHDIAPRMFKKSF